MRWLLMQQQVVGIHYLVNFHRYSKKVCSRTLKKQDLEVNLDFFDYWTRSLCIGLYTGVTGDEQDLEVLVVLLLSSHLTI